MRRMIRSIIAVAATGLFLVACSESRNPIESSALPVEQSSQLVIPNPSVTEFIVFGDAALPEPNQR